MSQAKCFLLVPISSFFTLWFSDSITRDQLEHSCCCCPLSTLPSFHRNTIHISSWLVATQNKGYFPNLSVAKFWPKENAHWCAMGWLLKISLASFLCLYFLSSFLHLAAGNVNVMTGAWAAILDHKAEVMPPKYCILCRKKPESLRASGSTAVLILHCQLLDLCTRN